MLLVTRNHDSKAASNAVNQHRIRNYAELSRAMEYSPCQGRPGEQARGWAGVHEAMEAFSSRKPCVSNAVSSGDCHMVLMFVSMGKIEEWRNKNMDQRNVSVA